MITNRLKTYTIHTIDNNEELDFLDSKLSSYVPQSVGEFRIPQSLDGRIDLIANFIYGDVNLWWLIARVNNMIDVVEECASGKVIYVAELTDYYDYYKKNVSPYHTTNLKSPLSVL